MHQSLIRQASVLWNEAGKQVYFTTLVFVGTQAGQHFYSRLLYSNAFSAVTKNITINIVFMPTIR